MVEIPDKIRGALIAYVKKLNEEIRVNRVVLFGSYAKGASRTESDVDLAVVSEDFTDKRSIDAVTYLLSRARGLDLDLEPLGLSPQEYFRADGGGVVEEIRRSGLVIFEDGKFLI